MTINDHDDGSKDNLVRNPKADMAQLLECDHIKKLIIDIYIDNIHL